MVIQKVLSGITLAFFATFMDSFVDMLLEQLFKHGCGCSQLILYLKYHYIKLRESPHYYLCRGI